jgi:hypothetical protein
MSGEPGTSREADLGRAGARPYRLPFVFCDSRQSRVVRGIAGKNARAFFGRAG